MCRVANDGESILPQDPWLQGRSTFLQLHQRCVSPSISLTHKSESASGLEIPTLDSFISRRKRKGGNRTVAAPAAAPSARDKSGCCPFDLPALDSRLEPSFSRSGRRYAKESRDRVHEKAIVSLVQLN